MKISEIKQRLEELGGGPKRALGQNFLINERVTEKILAAVAAMNPAQIIEIGPGLGTLTRSLMENGIPLQLLELDERFARYWREAGALVAEADALKWNWENESKAIPTVLVSNLPYQIASSLVIDRCAGPRHLKGMVLMFQREVAERIAARASTPEYGFLTVMAQTFWQVDTVCDAGPRDFYPAPKVKSRVLRFVRHENVAVEYKKFLTFVKVAFSQRRKLFVSNMQGLGNSPQRVWWHEALAEMDLPETIRAEQLTVVQFQNLYHKYIEAAVIC
jgi:16S rRNA (adenine1518-N6/adenine1519-N6)-dimethyltransferase